jgi:D-alanine-D-alanine ligase-like ATP-grasp enzyme
MIKVGVLRGGAGDSYSNSLLSGGHILSQLRGDKLSSVYKPIDIFIDDSGVWHIGGVPIQIHQLKDKVDIIFNALHCNDVMNGEIGGLLEDQNIPYTGSNSSSCGLVSNPILLKEQLSKNGINIPKHILYTAYLEDLDGPQDKYIKNTVRDIFNRLPPPWVVKPFTKSSSMGVFFCNTIDDLMNAISFGVKQNISIIVEEKIEGKHVSISVLEKFRDKDIYSSLCDDNFIYNEKRGVEKLATDIHRILKLGHYSQSHFVVNSKKGIYFMGIDTHPKLDENSLLYKHSNDVGLSFDDFIDHIIKLSLN